MHIPFPSYYDRYRVSEWVRQRAGSLALAAALVSVADKHPFLRFLAVLQVVGTVLYVPTKKETKTATPPAPMGRIVYDSDCTLCPWHNHSFRVLG